MNEPVPANFVEQLDLQDQRHRHEMKQKEMEYSLKREAERTRRTQARTHALLIAFVVSVVAGLLAGAGYWIHVATSGPEKPDEEAQREQACFERGGGWVPEDLLNTSDRGMCVMPGARAS